MYQEISILPKASSSSRVSGLIGGGGGGIIWVNNTFRCLLIKKKKRNRSTNICKCLKSKIKSYWETRWKQGRPSRRERPGTFWSPAIRLWRTWTFAFMSYIRLKNLRLFNYYNILFLSVVLTNHSYYQAPNILHGNTCTQWTCRVYLQFSLIYLCLFKL